MNERGPGPHNARRFPPPWSVEELDAYFVVRDDSGHLPLFRERAKPPKTGGKPVFLAGLGRGVINGAPEITRSLARRGVS
jgi:hypothetical protein